MSSLPALAQDSAPNWSMVPAAGDISESIPQRARNAGVAGKARMRCEVAVSGKLRNCTIVDEDPEGWGFGEALVKMAPKFTFVPKIVGGQPVDGGVVVIPMRFQQLGWAILECSLDQAGLARGCRLLSEAPKGRGVGRQALEFAEGEKPEPGIPVRNGKVRWTIQAPVGPPGVR